MKSKFRRRRRRKAYRRQEGSVHPFLFSLANMAIGRASGKGGGGQKISFWNFAIESEAFYGTGGGGRRNFFCLRASSAAAAASIKEN